ncbi:MAG: YbaB/EbfC family nucleoid-associated protein [Endomicrobium sp.]|jgi:DNA-binding protein YbaB|nr:YbaB/EbfC family nucleoid-associated protein [Endomicrobium sp.]
MELFKMAKEAMAMRSKMNEIDKKLRAQVIEVEYKGIKIRVNAKTEFLDLNLPEEVLKQDKEKAEKFILSAFTEATKKAQNIMNEEVKKLTHGMKIPGL